MIIKNKKVMILGGFGLVGRAVCREILKDNPSEIILTSLQKSEAEQACADFEYAGIPMTPIWGNLFVREELKDLSRADLMGSSKNRQILINDVLEALNEEILANSFFYQVIQKHRPDIIIDCVNSATALAYQDIYTGYFGVKNALSSFKQECGSADDLMAEVEKFVGTVYIPQLIRHVQILYEATRRFEVSTYIKIGTSGTGGMGLNIPYTHSEEKPSRVLLSKTSLAGAHSLLLFLMARTPDAPMVKEVKPATAIAWKKIGYGEVKRHGAPIPLYDCAPDKGVKLEKTLPIDQKAEFQELGENLKSVYIDTGENGIFSFGEFYTITSVGQMQYVTPEEIARNVVTEIKGGNTGRDVIGAIDSSIMGSTYRAGYMRAEAVEKMNELIEAHECDSVAFENLGPPRLSKLLYEAHLLKLVGKKLEGALKFSPTQLTEKLSDIIRNDADLRSKIISIGIPVLMPDGKTLLRGPSMKIPVFRGESELEVTPENLQDWTYNGWVDLRESNMKLWLYRLHQIKEYLDNIDPDDTSSRYHHGINYWKPDSELHIGRLVAWIFINEEKGERIKD
jgi:hypothetical protein